MEPENMTRHQLLAIVLRLDRTVDGVVVVPGDDVYDVLKFEDGRPPRIEKHETCLASYTGDYYDPHPTNVNRAYSTREAAESAVQSD